MEYDEATEICNIRLVHRKKGFLGLATEMWWIAEVATSEGIKIIAKSATLETSAGGVALQDIAQPQNLKMSQS
jgi:hypothetical protein